MSTPAVVAAGAPLDGAEDCGMKKRRPAEQGGGGGGGGGKKARKALLAAARAAVEAANRGLRVEPSEHRTTGGQTVQLHMHGRLERGTLLLSWVAALVEENMRAHYERGWGWDGSLSLSLCRRCYILNGAKALILRICHRDAKLAELAAAKARYIIASLLPAAAQDSAPTLQEDPLPPGEGGGGAAAGEAAAHARGSADDGAGGAHTLTHTHTYTQLLIYKNRRLCGRAQQSCQCRDQPTHTQHTHTHTQHTHRHTHTDRQTHTHTHNTHSWCLR